MNDEDTAQLLIEGLRIYYNFIRPHMALNGKTPAEVAGMELELGKNRWYGLIRKVVGRPRFAS